MIKFTLMIPFLFAIGFINGALREMTYKKMIGEPWAHHISVLTGVLLLGIAVWHLLKKWKIKSAKEALLVGIVWIILTDLIEFIMVYFFMKKPVSFFFNMHNIFAGESWIVVLLWLGIMPILFFRMSKEGISRQTVGDT